MKSKITLITFTTLWTASVAFGMGVLMRYENVPGRAAKPASQWPTSSRLHPSSNRPTLVMFVHPKCPCTRASISELARLVAQCQGELSVEVLFLKPAGVGIGWEKTDLWNSADAIPGVQVFTDFNGEEARRFHAQTSGQTLLFGPGGSLLFSGGITASRGYEGDNFGRDAIVSFVKTGRSVRDHTFVFGCSLQNRSTS